MALVIVDPISSYLGKTNSHINAAVRGVLEPLTEMAERMRVAVLSVTHFSKGGANSTGKALHCFIGSIAFVGAPRMAFAVIEDADNSERRLLLHAKNNLAAPPPGLAYRLKRTIVGDGKGIIASCVDRCRSATVTRSPTTGPWRRSRRESGRDRGPPAGRRRRLRRHRRDPPRRDPRRGGLGHRRRRRAGVGVCDVDEARRAEAAARAGCPGLRRPHHDARRRRAGRRARLHPAPTSTSPVASKSRRRASQCCWRSLSPTPSTTAERLRGGRGATARRSRSGSASRIATTRACKDAAGVLDGRVGWGGSSARPRRRALVPRRRLLRRAGMARPRATAAAGCSSTRRSTPWTWSSGWSAA